MFSQQRAIPFRWILPIAQLLLCIVALWPLRGAIIQELRLSVRLKPDASVLEALRKDRKLNILMIPLTPEQRQAYEAEERRKWIPCMLNLPAGLAQLPFVIISPSHQEFTPRAMELWTWRAFSWPLLGVLFWWSAGRGIEALIAVRRRSLRPRISWAEAIIGGALFLFCSVMAVAVLLEGDIGKVFSVKLWAAGSITWAVLGAVMISARAAQWRVRKKLGSTQDTALP